MSSFADGRRDLKVHVFLWRPRHRWEDSIESNIKEGWYMVVSWNYIDYSIIECCSKPSVLV